MKDGVHPLSNFIICGWIIIPLVVFWNHGGRETQFMAGRVMNLSTNWSISKFILKNGRLNLLGDCFYNSINNLEELGPLSTGLFHKRTDLRGELLSLAVKEETSWRQRCKTRWLVEGDALHSSIAWWQRREDTILPLKSWMEIGG